MYKVYVIEQGEHGSKVLMETKTDTRLFSVAEFAFWELHRHDHSPRRLLLMTHDGRQVAAYRYGSSPGDRDYIAPGSKLEEKEPG